MKSLACMIGEIALPVALAVCLGGCDNTSPESEEFDPNAMWVRRVEARNATHIVWRLKNIESKLDQVLAAQRAAMPAENPKWPVKRLSHKFPLGK